MRVQLLFFCIGREAGCVSDLKGLWRLAYEVAHQFPDFQLNVKV